jgi:hypothetical protein
MHLLVTCRTFGKDFFIFHLTREMDVELYMASLTVNPVFATFGFDKVIKARMTPPTLFWFYELSLCGIQIQNIFFGGRLGRSWCHAPNRT